MDILIYGGYLFMNIKTIEAGLQGCTCGRAHHTNIRAVEIGSGITANTGEILTQNGFPKNILLVADKNTLLAGAGVVESLLGSGFTIKQHIYDNLRTADMEQVEVLEKLSAGTDGIFSVGSGSLNDICRLAAFRQHKAFAIYATAPSMDGFASNSAPITKNNFKYSYPAVQPSVIIADTKVLAAAPAELKSAGFGDMIGKYIGLADWRIANLITGEYYCPKIAALSEQAVEKIAALADKVTENDEESAAAIMESLVLTGLCMGFADSVRPASGAEHVLSHFWEIKKLQQGLLSDYHGKKVGVATVLVNKIYRDMAQVEDINPVYEDIDWENLKLVYGEGLVDDMIKANSPTVTQGITPEHLKACWGGIRRIVAETLPENEELLRHMNAAGTPVSAAEIDVTPALCELGIKYSAFMRYRLTLMRLMPMLNI